jgi:hypothetical protein
MFWPNCENIAFSRDVCFSAGTLLGKMSAIILRLMAFATSIIGHGTAPDWEFRL